MSKKINAVKIKLQSTLSSHFYTTFITKNRRGIVVKNQGKFKIKKYDPILRKHVEYIQKKYKFFYL